MNTITNTNTSTESETARLRALCDVIEQADLEAEERRALERMTPALEDSGIRKVERLLEGEMSRRVLTLTPQMWASMSQIERLNMTNWTERRIKALSEKLCMQRRLGAAAEPDVPAYLRHG